MPLISEIRVVQILEVVCKCLDDEVISVRDMAATYVIFFWPLIALQSSTRTLSGIFRCSPPQTILALKFGKTPSSRQISYNFIGSVRSSHASDEDPSAP